MAVMMILFVRVFLLTFVFRRFIPHIRLLGLNPYLYSTTLNTPTLDL